MKLAYVDAFSGISGDMFLGALVDAGLPLDHLKAQLALLPWDDAYELQARQVHKGALRACLVEVILGDHSRASDAPEPQHEHLHGDHDQPHDHTYENLLGDQNHPHKDSFTHQHSRQRGLSEIEALIEGSGLSKKVKETSLKVFRLLAEAEARVHGTTIEEVHFHEVGAVDSIIDIVGAAIGLDYLGIERLYASALPMGSGQVVTQHGLLPLPAPATLEILALAHAKTVPSPAQVELVTPTGAALLGALALFEQPRLVLAGVGVGAGQRELPWPNILRLVIGEQESGSAEAVVLIETNIDDMNPQLFGNVMNRLLTAGALDVFFTAVQMTKNRPGTMLSVVARQGDEVNLVHLILKETTTLGLRVHPVRRYEAGREFRTVQTPFGSVPMKLKLLDGEVIQAAPEYDACLKLAELHGVPLVQVYNAALSAGLQIKD